MYFSQKPTLFRGRRGPNVPSRLKICTMSQDFWRVFYLDRMEGWSCLCYTHLPTWENRTWGYTRLPMLYSFTYLKKLLIYLPEKTELEAIHVYLCYTHLPTWKNWTWGYTRLPIWNTHRVHLNMNYNCAETYMMEMKETLRNICFSYRCKFSPCRVTKSPEA